MAQIDDALISLARNQTVCSTEHLFAADWFTRLGQLIEALHEKLLPLHVTPGQLTDMALAVAVSESNAESNASHRQDIYSDEARHSIDFLTAHGLPANTIAEAFGLSELAVHRYLKGRRRTPREPEILALHHQGLSPSQIAQRIQVSQQLADKVVRRNGEVPNVIRGLSDAKKQEALDLYQAHTHTWTKACAELGITRGQFRNVLRAAGEIK